MAKEKPTKLSKKEKSFLKKLIPLVALVGGLCCFTPIILVLFGLSSVAFAASLSNTLYYGYKWYFRGAALILLLASVAWYFYKKEGVCSIDALKRKRKKIINLVLLAIIAGVIAYIIWLYVILEIIGILLGIWGNPLA
jgi:cation transport ATPase